MNVDGETWKNYICERIQDGCRRAWKDGFNGTGRQKEYVRMKEISKNESFADGSVGTGLSRTDGKERMFAREKE